MVAGFHIDPKTGVRGVMQYGSKAERVTCELGELVEAGLFDEAEARVDDYFETISHKPDFKTICHLEARCMRVESTTSWGGATFHIAGPLSEERYKSSTELLKMWADDENDDDDVHAMIDALFAKRIEELEAQGSGTLKEQMRVYVDCMRMRIVALHGEMVGLGC